MNTHAEAFIRRISNPVRFGMFLLLKLPSAFFSGIRIKQIDPGRCTTSVPYRWFTQNPFRSTYFACLAMAAEMSTGALAMAHAYKRYPRMSMLVLKLEAGYFKKATGVTLFTCEDGQLIRQAVEQSLTGDEAQVIRVKSTGINIAGEPVAEFFVTWSFKATKRKE